MRKSISILGSTGSIGTQSLEVARELGIKVCALSCKSNIDLLEKQIREFRPSVVAVESEKLAMNLKNKIKDIDTRVLAGVEGLCEVASCNESEILLNSVVGMVGLEPTLCAIESGVDIALANKETLVSGGALVMKRAKEKNVNIIPVDSEHSAIFQCLRGCPSKKALRKIILTASGGPFFGKGKSELKKVKKEDALKHPNWSMGSKITIDSATMMNKGLEIVEASWLFDMVPDDVEVVVHRESVIHSLIEYVDHSMIAQLGVPSMKIPIQYAFTFPERFPSMVKSANLCDIGTLSFFKPDYETFEALNICTEAIKRGDLFPAVMNGANEEAVYLFLNDKITFLDITKFVKKAMTAFEDSVENKKLENLNDILKADKWARKFIKNEWDS